jgi:DNA transposition AAA+ family ATPase
MPTDAPTLETAQPDQDPGSDAAASQANTLNAMHAVKMRVPGDQVNKATEHMSDEFRSAIRWFHAYGFDNNLSTAELGGLIGYDATVISRVFWGKYPGRLDKVVQKIQRFKDVVELQNNTVKRAPFIMTSAAELIWGTCDYALKTNSLLFIYGESQSGKTSALVEYARTHNHGTTIYVRMPATCAMVALLNELCISLRMGTGSPTEDKRRRVIDAFSDKMLLIVDEVHQTMIHTQQGFGAVRPLEYLREIYDRSGCGMILCSTPVFARHVDQGRYSQVLEQLMRRSLPPVNIPSDPTAADLDLFAKYYHLKPAVGESRKLQDRVIREKRLGRWCTILRAGAILADAAKERITWDHVIAAHGDMQAHEYVAQRTSVPLPKAA